mmetsp:Transcript_24975/g.74344  ORF Transcript_24975/g.74344 Transcript_24975/m.74344 type:complete len:120 (+) Transcript_24975:2-361(+)
MKAMKAAMKAPMKAMRAMKAKKVSVIAKGKLMRAMVFQGAYAKTKTGLRKADLHKNKDGKIVTKASTAAGKKAFKRISAWNRACKTAKRTLGLKGFVPVGGKSAQGKALYKKARALYGA